jgi:hypothetical protein
LFEAHDSAQEVTLVTSFNEGCPMNDAVTPNRWFRAWRSRSRPAQPDPADLGTAFGLDASFDQAHEAPRAAAAPAKPGWMQRLSVRGWRAA